MSDPFGTSPAFMPREAPRTPVQPRNVSSAASIPNMRLDRTERAQLQAFRAKCGMPALTEQEIAAYEKETNFRLAKMVAVP